MLQPLQEWVCDTCKQLISKPSEGYVEWVEDLATSMSSDFHIVHAGYYSPFRKNNPHSDASCYQHQTARGRRDLPLDSFLNAEGIVRLLSFIDIGKYHEPTYSGVHFANGREFAELFRRLHLPYYEEARLHWSTAQANGDFDGANEDWLYQPKILKRIIEAYGNQP